MYYRGTYGVQIQQLYILKSSRGIVLSKYLGAPRETDESTKFTVAMTTVNNEYVLFFISVDKKQHK